MHYSSLFLPFISKVALGGGTGRLPLDFTPRQSFLSAEYYTQICPNDKHAVSRSLSKAVMYSGSIANGITLKDVQESNLESPSDSNAPDCIQSPSNIDQYCAYTIPEFASGRGLSIVVSPHNLHNIIDTNITHNLLEPSYPLSTDPPHFYETTLPGRGRGLIANHTFKRGDLIMIARPVLIIDESSFDTLAKEERFAFQRRAVEALPEEGRHLFRALAAHWGGDEVEDRIITNAFGVGCGFDGRKFAVVVPEAARFNHDCRPNARFAFNPSTLTHKVHAVRTILPGEELTISYLDEKQPHSSRQTYIHEHWGFKCSCTQCSLPAPLRQLSDQRIANISALRTSLLDFTPNRGTTATTQIALQLIELYENETLHSSLAEAYIFAALRYCIWEDEVNTKLFAKKALEAWLMWEKKGGNKVMVQELLKNPAQSWCWALGAQEQWEL